MSAEEKRAFEHRVASWRAEQLVKRWLKANIEPESVSEARVKEYYEKHPQRFGGGERKRYEILQVVSADDPDLRDRAIDLLARARKTDDWARFAREHSSAELPVDLRRGRSGPELENEQLRKRLERLEKGEVSSVSTAGGRVSVVRVTAEEQLAPRPLAEVRADIRRRLAPTQLRSAVKEVMDRAMTDAKVDYLRDGAKPEQ